MMINEFSDKRLHCHMNGQYVGCLAKTKGHLSFEYATSCLDAQNSLPISMSIPLNRGIAEGAHVDAFFDNLLPDSEFIRKQLACSTGAYSHHTFDLLAVIGSDCIGALTFSINESTQPMTDVDIEPLDAHGVRQQIHDARLGKQTSNTRSSPFRFSLSGAQDKTALTFFEGTWGLPVGNVPTTHIIKPRILTRPGEPDFSNSVENEWFCLRVLYYMGFAVNKASIQSFVDEDALVVERFDRHLIDGEILRIPQEDFCQALGVPSNKKYEQHGGPGAKDIMQVLSSSLTAHQDQKTFMKAQLVFWVLAAIDGHAKNFSIKHTPHGFASIGALHPKKREMAMAILSKNKHYHWNTIVARHWPNHAANVSFPTASMDSIVDEVLNEIPSALEAAQCEAETIGGAAYEIGERITNGALQALNRLASK